MTAVTVYLDGVPLDTVAPVSDVVLTADWRGATGISGPSEARWTVLLGGRERPSILTEGRAVQVRSGGWPIVSGTLTQVDYETGQCIAAGASTEGASALAFAASGQVTTIPDTAITQAAARGAISWKLPASLSTTAVNAEQTDLLYVKDLISQWQQVDDSLIRVGADRAIRKVAAPTTPHYWIPSGVVELSWSANDDQPNRLFAHYQDGAGQHYTHVDAPGNHRMIVEQGVELTERGSMTEAEAQQILRSILAELGDGSWVGNIELAVGELVTFGGQPADPAAVFDQAGKGLVVRLYGQDDPRPSRPAVGYVDVAIQTDAWAVTTDNITLTPRGSEANTFEDVLAEMGLK